MGPKKVLSSFEPKKKVSSFSNYLNVLFEISLSSQKKLSVSLSLSFVFETRAHLRRKKSQNNKTLRVVRCSSFFSEEDSLWAKEDRPRFESEEKERSEMYKIDERVFFFVCRERALAHHPGSKKKNSKTLNT